MNLQKALKLGGIESIHVVLERLNLEHLCEVVGGLSVLAVLDRIGSDSFNQVRYEYSLEANSDLDLERFTVLGDININLTEFADLDQLKRHIMTTVTYDLIGQAVSVDNASLELKDAYNAWDLSTGEAFKFECEEGFNIVLLATETAELICQNIEKYFALK